MSRRRAPRGLSLAGALAAVVLVAAAAGTRGAAAEGDDEPVRLEYHAGPGCPDEEGFLARVRARTARVRLVGAGEQGRTFTVRLGGAEHPWGSVTVLDGARSEGTRRLEADTCGQVADALALMVALAVDPRALASPPVEPAAPAVALDAGPDAVAELDAGSPPDSSPPADSAPPPASPPPVSPPVDAAPPSPPRTLHFFGGVDFAVATAVAPDTLFAAAPYLGWRSTRPALLGPSLRVAFVRAGTGTIPVPSTGGGGADFTWTVGRLDGCAMLWPDRPLRLGGCARVEAGILQSSGEGVGNARTQGPLWFALGALGRFEWSFFGPLMLDLEAGPSFRVTANEFYVQTSTTQQSAYTVSPVGFSAEGGLGVHFL